jgi:hypothetical protein
MWPTVSALFGCDFWTTTHCVEQCSSNPRRDLIARSCGGELDPCSQSVSEATSNWIFSQKAVVRLHERRSLFPANPATGRKVNALNVPKTNRMLPGMLYQCVKCHKKRRLNSFPKLVRRGVVPPFCSGCWSSSEAFKVRIGWIQQQREEIRSSKEAFSKSPNTFLQPKHPPAIGNTSRPSQQEKIVFVPAVGKKAP